MKPDFDIAVIGSGFSGSLLAMIAKHLGYSVVLLERGKHPRFVIGESSTPLANLLLEELATRYKLPRFLPLTKWGTWQQHYPQIGCGLKRGFTFYHHVPGKLWVPDPNHTNELLIAASPNERIADTHWYRPDFDEFFVREAQAAGVEYLDEVKLETACQSDDGIDLIGHRLGQPLRLRAKYVFDASGPRGFLHQAFGLGEQTLAFLPQTQALYSHFTDVRRWDELFPMDSSAPYPADDAALHHVFEGGWIWVLRFKNGITSAGVAATKALSERLQLREGESGWKRLLETLPSVREQFARARVVQPCTFSSRLGFRSVQNAGTNWALLPSAAGFIDPLLSTGFPLALLGISRLAGILESNPSASNIAKDLELYSQRTASELELVEQLVAALYRHFHDFEVFTALTLLYFAAASFTETVRRLGHPERAGDQFLLGEHPLFGQRCRKCLRLALGLLDESARKDLLQMVYEAIEPVDIAGLTHRERRSYYPVLAEDLVANRTKAGASLAEVEELLARCGMGRERPSGTESKA
ncbi:MAG: 2-octaprenyl-6-methoxyphenyl hydroxylase [Verrucomicrobiales bacterium]|nr:2-octaprenyl-6-methoxyphenyl hydroxylase [Verrucomicrobiales bacterium]